MVILSDRVLPHAVYHQTVGIDVHEFVGNCDLVNVRFLLVDEVEVGHPNVRHAPRVQLQSSHVKYRRVVQSLVHPSLSYEKCH